MWTFPAIRTPRQHAITEMAFNMDLEGVMEFKGMWEAIQVGDWDGAATNAMLDSLWAKEVGQCAVHLATSMRTGMEVTQQALNA